MASRSLNKVQLIGNLTRDPELRYTPSGVAVCTFGLATNRSWTTDSGERKEDVEFHRLVAWSKLAELCSQLLAKGRKVYVEGRLQTRNWQGQDGNQRTTTEIVINDMLILDSRRVGQDGSDTSYDDGPSGDAGASNDESGGNSQSVGDQVDVPNQDEDSGKPVQPAKSSKNKDDSTPANESVDVDDIPF